MHFTERIRGKPALEGGLLQVATTVESYGNTTAYDSLAAIKHTVYDKKYFTLEHLLKVLEADFVGYEKERQLLLDAPKFGNDDDEADQIAVEMHEYICNAFRRQKNTHSAFAWMLVVVINNSMNVDTGRQTLATADGRKAYTYLSNGNNPTAGFDKEGLTALINSYTKMDTSIHACGNQNLKLSPEYFKGDMSKAKMVLRTFFKKGGQQLNLSVVNQADLEDALIHPEQHENLMVRVGGYTARFVTLDPAIQKDILARSAY